MPYLYVTKKDKPGFRFHITCSVYLFMVISKKDGQRDYVKGGDISQMHPQGGYSRGCSEIPAVHASFTTLEDSKEEGVLFL